MPSSACSAAIWSAVAPVGEVAVGDVDVEVLFHPEALDRGADGQPDAAGVGERAALDARADRGELGLGGGEQLFAFAGAFGGDERVAADDQPLAGKLI